MKYGLPERVTHVFLLLGVYHALGDAAVDGDALTIDKVTLGVTQEEAGACDILCCANPARGVEGVVFGA